MIFCEIPVDLRFALLTPKRSSLFFSMDIVELGSSGVGAVKSSELFFKIGLGKK